MDKDSGPTRVLLVDGSAALLWGLRKLVEGERPRMAVVGAVSDPDEALAYADLQPHVTLLDIDLRGASGLGYIAELRERSCGEVLVFTGLRDPAVGRRAAQQGARGLVAKDASGTVLLDAIERLRRGGTWGLGSAHREFCPDENGSPLRCAAQRSCLE